MFFIKSKFKHFLFLHKKAINFIIHSKAFFKDSRSHIVLNQALEFLEYEYSLYNKKGEERFKRMLITQDRLLYIQKSNSVILRACWDNLEIYYKIVDHILSIQDFFNSVKEKQLPFFERLALKKKHTAFLKLYKQSIKLTEKQIRIFLPIKHEILERGLLYLQGSYKRIKSAGILEIRRNMKIPQNKRPGRCLFGSWDGGYGTQLGYANETGWADEIIESQRWYQLVGQFCRFAKDKNLLVKLQVNLFSS